MIDISLSESSSGSFQLAVQSLREAELRDELHINQIAAPSKLATEAVAFGADVCDDKGDDHTDSGTGRLVLLHEPKPQDQWGGNFRIVAFAKSPLETEIGSDEEISEVAWAWLMEALRNRGAEFSHEAATITRVISSGFGSLANQSHHAELEMRASWSPLGNFAAHMEAWQDLVCMMSGYPLLPAEVTALHGRKTR
ncbi:MAG: hypothetical protein RIQ44_395 [Actinomycetota bacterium]